MTTSPNTLLINGNDLRTFFDGIRVVGDMHLYAPGTRRGSHDVIPGRAGQLGAELPYDAYAFSVTVFVSGSSREEMIANLMSLGTVLAGSNGLVTLTRRLAKVGGGFTSYTANGQFVQGLDLTLLNSQTGNTELQFINLDGSWWNGTSHIVP